MHPYKKIVRGNLDEMMERYANVLDNNEITCMCDARLESENLEYYQYPNSNECWLYVHCKNCDYDYSYPKIYAQYERIVIKKCEQFNKEFVLF